MPEHSVLANAVREGQLIRWHTVAQLRTQQQKNDPKFKLNDLILVKKMTFPKRKKKFSAKWYGPYKVTKVYPGTLLAELLPGIRLLDDEMQKVIRVSPRNCKLFKLPSKEAPWIIPISKKLMDGFLSRKRPSNDLSNYPYSSKRSFGADESHDNDHQATNEGSLDSKATSQSHTSDQDRSDSAKDNDTPGDDETLGATPSTVDDTSTRDVESSSDSLKPVEPSSNRRAPQGVPKSGSEAYKSSPNAGAESDGLRRSQRTHRAPSRYGDPIDPTRK